MTPPKRVDLAGAAAILGVAPDAVTRYVYGRLTNGEGVQFPLPVVGYVPYEPGGPRGDRSARGAAVWEFLERDVKAWGKHRTGRGGPGVPKNRTGKACDRCGNVVERRKKDPVTGELLCKRCDLAAGEAELGQ